MEGNPMADNAETLRVLDKLIGDLRDELDRARAAADRIPQLSSDLAALERARAMVSGDAHESAVGPWPPAGTMPMSTIPSLQPVTEVTLNVLREAAKPVMLDDVMAAVWARVPNAKRTTVMSHLSRFVEAGRVRRVAPSTYEFVK
jgi:hypothetical protein